MTNSYNLSPAKLPNLILIHGSNNNAMAFKPLFEELKNLGWNVHFVTLPCHGDHRREALDLDSAMDVFDKSMAHLIQEPYVVVAFSHGGLYLQLWQQRFKRNLPLKQVLLAPSLYIYKQKLADTLFNTLPKFFFIKSFAPARFRRYQFLTVWEYRILVGGMVSFHQHKTKFKVPTLLLIDPKDELVDPEKMKQELAPEEDPLLEFKFWNRDYLKKSFTCHHILFHPDYFSKEDWVAFRNKIQEFLKA